MSHFCLLNFTKNNFNFTEPLEIAKSLQNYCMNFETVLLNDDNYNFQEPYTVSESVFWHWMTKNGLNLEAVDGQKNIYREQHYASADKDRMIQCFGSIDAGNSLSTEFGMYNETYVSVPTSYGNGPVFFRVATDNPNIYPNGQYPTTSVTGGTYIEGRSETDFNYLGDLRARYDKDGKYIINSPFEVVRDFPTLQSVLTKLGATGANIQSWDSVNIDENFALDNITETVGNITNRPYSLSGECEYKFNAILLYYSIYNLSDVYKQPVATNLFGIVFLDGGSEQNERYLLQPIVKKKSYTGQTGKNAYFGNSYSFRINIKTMSVYDNTDARIDDNTTMTSMYSQDFNDVISNLNSAIAVLNANVQTTKAIQDRYQQMLATLADFRVQFDNYQKTMNQQVNDQIAGTCENIKQELTTKMKDEFEDMWARIEEIRPGTLPTEDEESDEVQATRSSSVFGASASVSNSQKSSGTVKQKGKRKIYTLGKPSVTEHPSLLEQKLQNVPSFDTQVELSQLQQEVAALRSIALENSANNINSDSSTTQNNEELETLRAEVESLREELEAIKAERTNKKNKKK